MKAGLLTATGLLLAGMSTGAAADPALNAAQQAKLKAMQAAFAPGAKAYDSNAYGFSDIAKSCGAAMPMTIDPSLALLETDPNREGDRTDIGGLCNELAIGVVNTCGTQDDADPVVKDMVRSNVKKLVCRGTANASDVNNEGVKYALDGGTLTLTALFKNGKLNAGNVHEEGEKFLKKNVAKNGLSIGGQQRKREMLKNLSMENSSLRKRLKDECGLSVKVTVDDKLAEESSKWLGTSPIATCNDAMQIAYNNCSSSGDKETEITSPVIKDALKKNLKGFSCVYSDAVSMAVRPGGILEVGSTEDAKIPLIDGKQSMSTEKYFFRWMKANIQTLGSGGTPATGPTAGDKSSGSRSTRRKVNAKSSQ